MAQQLAVRDQSEIPGAVESSPGYMAPTRYTEQRTAQFVGGSIDPQTGNVTEGSKITPEPKSPSTRLGEMGAEPKSSVSPLGAAALDVGGKYAGATLGAEFGAQLGAGIGASEAAKNTLSGAGYLLKGGEGTAAASLAGEGAGAALGGASAATGIISGGVDLGVSMLQGQSFKEAAPGAAGSAIGATAGFAIGSVLLPGIGGPIGAAVGSWAGKTYLGRVFDKWF